MERTVLVIQYRKNCVAVSGGLTVNHLLVAWRQTHPRDPFRRFLSCSRGEIPPYDEEKPEVVIMDCGDTLPGEYAGKVPVMRAVWRRDGSVDYIRHDRVQFV